MRSRLVDFLGAFLLAVCLPTVALADLKIISRGDWKALPAKPGAKMQKPVKIMIHHTGTKSKPGRRTVLKMQNLQHFSQSEAKLADGGTKPAWNDVPYHFYIAANGEIAEGRAVDAVGDTNTAYDPTGYIQVVLEGNFDLEIPSEEQIAGLDTLLDNLLKQYNIGYKDITYHQHLAQTACPGKNLIQRLSDITAIRRQR